MIFTITHKNYNSLYKNVYIPNNILWSDKYMYILYIWNVNIFANSLKGYYKKGCYMNIMCV